MCESRLFSAATVTREANTTSLDTLEIKMNISVASSNVHKTYIVTDIMSRPSSLVINHSNLNAVEWKQGIFMQFNYINCNQNQIEAFPRAALPHH